MAFTDNVDTVLLAEPASSTPTDAQVDTAIASLANALTDATARDGHLKRLRRAIVVAENSDVASFTLAQRRAFLALAYAVLRRLESIGAG